MTNLHDQEVNKNLDPQISVIYLKRKIKFYPSKIRKIICFGDDTFDDLCKGLEIDSKMHKKEVGKKNLRFVSKKMNNEETWKIFRVYKHNSYGAHQQLGDVELPAQLKYINDLVF
jgi:hypothetical protein